MDASFTTLLFTSLFCISVIGSPHFPGQKRNVDAKIPAPPKMFTTSSSPPDISQAKYVIKNDICRMNVNDEAITVVIMVISHLGNQKSRNEIRSVYPADKMRKLGIRRVFMLGSLKNETEPNSLYVSAKQSDIEKENELNRDIVQFNVIESYTRLAVKSLLAMYWASKNCQEAKYVLKMDDDLLVSYYGVLETLKAIKDEDRHTLIGNLYKEFSMPVVRDDGKFSRDFEKYFMTYEEFSDDFYPPYLSGMLYATSPNTAGLLAKTSKEVGLFKMEDIYVTGMVAAKANVRRTDISKVVSADTTLTCCRDDVKNVMYNCRAIVSFGKNVNQRTALKQISDHEEYCFVSKKCAKWTEDLSKNENVSCF